MEKTEQLRPAGPGVGLDAGGPLEDAQAADELRRVDMSRDESLEPERPIEGGLDDPPIAAVAAQRRCDCEVANLPVCPIEAKLGVGVPLDPPLEGAVGREGGHPGEYHRWNG